MASEENIIELQTQEPTFYARIPKMAIMDLGPYELALYCNFKQTASDSGYCDKSNARLSKETSMSVSKVKTARKSLEAKGFIKTEHRRDDSGIENQTVYVTIVDVWEINHARYAKEGGHEVTTPSQNATTPQPSENPQGVTKNLQRRTYLKKASKSGSKKPDPATLMAKELIQVWSDAVGRFGSSDTKLRMKQAAELLSWSVPATKEEVLATVLERLLIPRQGDYEFGYLIDDIRERRAKAELARARSKQKDVSNQDAIEKAEFHIAMMLGGQEVNNDSAA